MNQNTRRKGNFQVPENIGSGHHQTIEDERKKKRKVSQTNEKLLEIKLSSKNMRIII